MKYFILCEIIHGTNLIDYAEKIFLMLAVKDKSHLTELFTYYFF